MFQLGLAIPPARLCAQQWSNFRHSSDTALASALVVDTIFADMFFNACSHFSTIKQRELLRCHTEIFCVQYLSTFRQYGIDVILSIIAAGSSSTSSSMLLVSPSALTFNDFTVLSSLDDSFFVVAPPAERCGDCRRTCRSDGRPGCPCSRRSTRRSRPAETRRTSRWSIASGAASPCQG